MTLLDMYHYDKNVLLPITSYNYKYFKGVDFVNYLLTVFSLTECGYNEPPLFAEMCNNFMSVHDKDIKIIIDSIITSDSIDVSKFSYTRKNNTFGSGSESSNGNGSGTGENKVSAFNSEVYQPDATTTTSTNTTSKTNTSYYDDRTENYKENVKASEQLEAVERRLRLYRNNVYVTVAGWFADELLICVW